MAQLYVGTSGWAYPSWKPDFYPAKLPQKKFLRHYATQLNTVEVNFTFRQLIRKHCRSGLRNARRLSFRSESPPGHHPHQAPERDGGFCAAISQHDRTPGTGRKTGPGPVSAAAEFKADVKLLEEFLPALPRAVQAAFEFRNPSWFTDEIFNLLKSSNRALCVAETEERVTPDVVTADFCYYRYRKPSYTRMSAAPWWIASVSTWGRDETCSPIQTRRNAGGRAVCGRDLERSS